MPSARPRPSRIVARRGGADGIEVGLRQHQRRRHATGGGERDDALAAALVGLGERLDDEHELDVGRQHLARDGRTGGATHDGAAPLEHGGDDAFAVERDPVAGRRGALAGGAHAAASGDEPRRRVAAVGDEPAAAVLSQHAGGGERWIAELRELGGEIRSPANGGGWGMQGEVLHGFVSGSGAASVPGRCPGRVIRRPRRE